jgi:hypothetical protein
MMDTSVARANFVGFLAVLTASALTMVWLFWHYPVKTIVASVAILAALGISGRLARSMEADGGPTLDQGERSR